MCFTITYELHFQSKLNIKGLYWSDSIIIETTSFKKLNLNRKTKMVDIDTIDPEFLPQVEELDADRILRHMDASAANQAHINARFNRTQEQMREEQN